MTHVKHRQHSRKVSKRQHVVEPYNAPYNGPYGAHPLTHVGFQEGRHLHPRRLPTPNGERTVSLRLLDISKETLDNVQVLAGTLRRLQIAGMHLKKIPENLVANLIHLKKLDLGENELVDSSFPETISDLEVLVEIKLNDNKLTKFPACLKKLKNLSRLDMSNNKLESVNGINKLRKLQILVLDNNKLTSLIKEISNLKRLEILRCCDNRIKEISHDVRNLQALSDIDVSQNRLTVLNTEIFKLPNLEALNASHNNITKIPSFSIQPHQKHWISILDISENNLAKFPGHLLQMTHHLDLSCNKIKVLPWNSIKKLDPDADQEIDVGGNPLSYPPLSVCESGLRSVTKYLQESEADVKIYQGIKILVLGSHRSGKTSLVQSLVDQQARVTRNGDDASAGIGVFETSFDYEVDDGRPSRSLHLCLWDFCGDPYYSYPHYVFFEQSAITVLTFNMAMYTKNKFYEQIGSWFDWMITKTNKLIVLLVATHCDLVSRDKIKGICDNVCEQLKKHMDEGRNMIEQRINKIEQQTYISPTHSEQLKSYMFLLRSKFSVQTNIIVTSSETYKGFDRLVSAIETLSNDRKLFPNVMRIIPTFWVKIETYLEEQGNTMVVPVLQWSQYVEDVTRKFGMKHLLREITQYLHETGKVIWFGNVRSLNDKVILRPSWLFDVLSHVYHHDVKETIQYDTGDHFKSASISQIKFDRMKRDLVSEGILDKDLLKGLLISHLHSDINFGYSFHQVLDLLLQAFEIGYLVTKRPKDLEVTFSLEPDNDKENKTDGRASKQLVQYLIPWIRHNPEPTAVAEKWESICNRRRLVVQYIFPRYIPPGLFERICTRVHADKFKLNFVAHWRSGIHTIHREQSVRIVLSLHQSDDLCSVMKFAVRDDTLGEDEVPTSIMWDLLLPLLLECDDFLKIFIGVLVERFVECPYCHRPGFPGEWATPKETQALSTKPCELCGENVDSGHLVQPKTKTRDDVLLNIRNRKRHRRGAAVTVDVDEDIYISPRESKDSIPNFKIGAKNISEERQSIDGSVSVVKLL